MYTLGINAAFHDSAACLFKDGIPLAAAEEERFTRIKHAKRPIPFSAYELPFHAIDYCLRHADIDIADIDHIAYSYDPQKRIVGMPPKIELSLEPSEHAAALGGNPWDPLFLSYVINAPRHLRDGIPHHLRERLKTDREPHFQWHFIDHHLSHAASAYMVSPFNKAAILTLDGQGEKVTTSYALGDREQIEFVGQVEMPHSLGILYEELTTYLGFLHSSDEYKVMALASSGKPRFKNQLQNLIQLKDDGQYEILEHSWTDLFGPARQKGDDIEQKHLDIARSMQEVLEDTVIHITNWLHRRTNSDNLSMAGGVALNCVMNSRIAQRGAFKNVWVQPAAGDSGTALGAALFVDASMRNTTTRSVTMDHVYLGPSYDDAAIEAVLKRSKLRYRVMNDVALETAQILSQNKIVGWFQGRMEFGPRALGARSILASPIQANMQDKLNEIKDREDFRPVAPVVLEEEAENWFVGAQSSPFMLFVYDVRKDREDAIPAVRHVDGTARIQTVRRSQNSLYYDLIKSFQTITGIPVLINTSFNSRSQPIVCSPQDALECFATSPLDALVMGHFLIEKVAS